MQNKKIIIAAVIIISGLGLWFLNYSYSNKEKSVSATEEIAEIITEAEAGAEVSKMPLDTSDADELAGRNAAWQAFQNYLAYNKNHDLAGVKSVVYKAAPVCLNPASSTECFARMDAAYAYGSEFKKEKLRNFYEDSRQAILASDWELVDNGVSVGQTRKIIFFVKEGENFKLLRFYPSKGAFLTRENQSVEELGLATANAVADDDQDGLEYSLDPDPKNRDTDGDGWWDGINTQFEI